MSTKPFSGLTFIKGNGCFWVSRFRYHLSWFLFRFHIIGCYVIFKQQLIKETKNALLNLCVVKLKLCNQTQPGFYTGCPYKHFRKQPVETLNVV